ncbi:uncharacterized protein LOC113323424 isoform X2 [Papaver somniferum]|uniref:uncharacterized protein LOC113323424 isoform X2 n=1 Tax=Papaver somniferum TaxID=3469 RepID=UPI000E705FA6|nr:uncharacterized protein LOC113323424 isoform X2 [Papaver somniferum]
MSDDLLRVSTTNLSSQSETSHYQHGIPGIPTDGKVVLLKNSSNGALIYLVGTNHHSVKKVIDNVKPDVVPIEQCEKRARSLMKLKPKHATLYKLFRFSMRTPGGLGVKLGMFLTNCQLRRLFAHGIFPGLDFKVAMEESSRVGARCFYIDQDIDVIDQQSPKSSLFDLLMETFCTKARGEVEYTRSYAHEMYSLHKKLFPDRYKVIIEGRDKFMFTNLRSFQGKIVAVIGLSHMDGIELLWKLAEEGDKSNVR